MNVLVTGASGFVGRAVVRRLAQDPEIAPRAGVRRPNVETGGLASQVLIPDLDSSGDWHAALAGVDVVVHLAARVHVMANRAKNPLAEYRRVNVAGTSRLARQAVEAGVRRFVFVSTVKVNGESTPAGRPFVETDRPRPTDPYGISKAEAEAALFHVAAGRMEIVVIRAPLVYGPGVKANFLTMARWLNRGIPLPLGAIDHNRRSLVGIDNLIDFISTCIAHPAAANEVFFTGDGEDLSTAELLRRTGAALGRQVRLIAVPPSILAWGAALLAKRDMWQRVSESLQVDISKAHALLQWVPTVSVDEGLRRAVGPFQRERFAA